MRARRGGASADCLAVQSSQRRALNGVSAGERLVQEHATAYQSLASPNGSSAHCSGDMYSGVPAISLLWAAST